MWRRSTTPEAARMPSAIGRSNAAPALRTSAGARLTVIRCGGNSNPELRIALRTRSRLSRTLASGRPTIVNIGRPKDTSTSTCTGKASTPNTAAVRRHASTSRGPASVVAEELAQSLQRLGVFDRSPERRKCNAGAPANRKKRRTKPAMQLCFLHDSLQRFSIASPREPTDMLDALKNLTGGKNKLVQKQTDELELMVASAREERAAISAMLTTLTTRSQKLAPLSQTLEQTTERVTGVTERLDDIAARLAQIDDRTKALEEVDLRIQALKDAADQAEQTTQKALGPDGELKQLRDALHQLSSQALSTSA